MEILEKQIRTPQKKVLKIRFVPKPALSVHH